MSSYVTADLLLVCANVRVPDKAGAATIRSLMHVRVSGGDRSGYRGVAGLCSTHQRPAVCGRRASPQSARWGETKRANCGIAAGMATLQLATRPPSQRRFATNRYRAGGLLLIVLAVACKKPAQDTASQRTDVSPALSVVAAPVAAGSNESEAAAQARDATYQQACKGGDMVGCANLGILHADGTGVPKDATKAAALFQQACAGGLAQACNR